MARVITLTSISEMAGREVSDLTRRDIAHGLLSAPAAEVLEDLPGLRRELVAAGSPLSGRFWESAEATLQSIAARTATYGDVRRWLEATGTEPSAMVGFFMWPEEGERGPVAEEMYARLVRHLEGAVAAGSIDPDRLLAGDETALASRMEVQTAWLNQPLPDGRVPARVVEDEQDDAFFAAWDEAEAEARQILARFLAEVGERPRPDNALREVCAELRRQLPTEDYLFGMVAAAGGVNPHQLPEDDFELWLTLAAGVVSPQDRPPSDFDDDDFSDDDDLDEDFSEFAAWMSIDLGAWIGAAVTLARGGPGTLVDGTALAGWAIQFDLDDGTFGPALTRSEWDDAVGSLDIGFNVVTTLWQALGALDSGGRLTELGWWGIPESLLVAWAPRNEGG